MLDKNDVVIIELDRPRQLWFGHKAIKTLGALTGKDFDAMDMNNMDLGEIEKIMYCLLLKDAKENNEILKLEDMEDLLDCAPFGVVTEKLYEAITVGMGSMNEGESGKNLQRIAMEAQSKKKSGTGTKA
ncbi:MAG: hypothetical protein RR891_07645 [Clostridium sp.]|uniref:hypothetical protein n=1 Tax=Clostridium sp. TaxID=1506 RepID=UPI003031C502